MNLVQMRETTNVFADLPAANWLFAVRYGHFACGFVEGLLAGDLPVTSIR